MSIHSSERVQIQEANIPEICCEINKNHRYHTSSNTPVREDHEGHRRRKCLGSELTANDQILSTYQGDNFQ